MIDGALYLLLFTAVPRQEKKGNLQDSVQTFFVHRHLDGNVWEGIVDKFVWTRFDGRIVFRVGVEVSNGTDASKIIHGRNQRHEGTTHVMVIFWIS